MEKETRKQARNGLKPDFDFFDMAQISAIPSFASESRARLQQSSSPLETPLSCQNEKNQAHTKSTEALIKEINRGTRPSGSQTQSVMGHGELGKVEDSWIVPSVYEKLEEDQTETQTKENNANAPKVVFIRLFEDGISKENAKTPQIQKKDQNSNNKEAKEVGSLEHQGNQKQPAHLQISQALNPITLTLPLRAKEKSPNRSRPVSTEKQKRLDLEQNTKSNKQRQKSSQSKRHRKDKSSQSPKNLTKNRLRTGLSIKQGTPSLSSRYKPLATFTKNETQSSKNDQRTMTKTSRESQALTMSKRQSSAGSLLRFSLKTQSDSPVPASLRTNNSKSNEKCSYTHKKNKMIEEVKLIQKAKAEKLKKKQHDKKLESFGASLVLRKQKMFLLNEETCIIIDKDDPKSKEMKIKTSRVKPDMNQFGSKGVPLIRAGDILDRNEVWGKILWRKVEEKRKEKEKSEMVQCTFKPDLSISKGSLGLIRKADGASMNSQETIRKRPDSSRKGYYGIHAIRKTEARENTRE